MGRIFFQKKFFMGGLFGQIYAGKTSKFFIGVSMEMWGVNQNWEQACQRGLPGKLGVGGNYLWCLVIVIFRGLGRAKRLGGGGGFKAII